MFDIADHLDDLRCWPTDRLRKERDALVDEQRRLHTRELAVLRVLDERGQVDPTLDAAGESARTVRDKLETARALESLPEIAAVAYDGDLSAEQLSAVTKLADQDSDAEWARRAPRVAPVELARLARNAVKPSTEDSRARYAARSLRMWWTPDKGMLQLHGQLPDVMGATFEATVQKLTEQMKPATGQAWDSFEHRAADALISLCEQPATEDETPSLASRPVVQLHVPPHGPGGDRRDPDRRLAPRAVTGQREHRTRAGRRRRCPGGGGEAFHRVVTQDRAGGAAARRVVPVRQL